MRILVTGSNGLLGQKLIYLLANNPEFELTATAIGENRCHLTSGYSYVVLDVTNRNQVHDVIKNVNPDCVIHTAAMTNVDACEADKVLCEDLNVNSVRYLVEICKERDIYLCFLSTDFVFDGLDGPYSEDDQPNPLSYYALSKYKAEQYILQSGIQASIIRTIIIYGVVDDSQRSNIVLWTINSLTAQKSINVINDQYRAPTLAEDLAWACVQACKQKATGVYHISGSETMSILEIVIQVADFFQLDKRHIKPVSSLELNQAAKRPPRTGFNLNKAIKELGYKPHSYLEGLAIVKEQLESKQKK